MPAYSTIVFERSDYNPNPVVNWVSKLSHVEVKALVSQAIAQAHEPDSESFWDRLLQYPPLAFAVRNAQVIGIETSGDPEWGVPFDLRVTVKTFVPSVESVRSIWADLQSSLAYADDDGLPIAPELGERFRAHVYAHIIQHIKTEKEIADEESFARWEANLDDTDEADTTEIRLKPENTPL